MKLLILVEIEGLPQTPDLLEEMLRHLILLESLGACILFYTSTDPSIACDALIDLAPSIISKRTILPILSNRDLTTLNLQEISGIKYNTVINCVNVHNDKHSENPISNYEKNIIILDSSSSFITYITKHAANRFTAFAINSEINKKLALLYNANLQRAKDDIEPLKAMANLRQQELKNSQAYLRLRYEQIELEIENKIAATMFSFFQTCDHILHDQSQFPALQLQCKEYLTITILEESVAGYKERLLQYGEALLKTAGNLYRILTVVQQNLDKATIVDSTLESAIANYRDRINQLIGIEKSIIDTAQSYTELFERYKTYTEETNIKLDDKVTETALATEKIDQSIKAIKKEFDETVGARKQDLLIESLLFTGDQSTHSSPIDPYESAFAACRAGDLAKLKESIDTIDNFKVSRLYHGKSLLEIACEYAYPKIVKYLVNEKSADVDCTLSARRPIFSALHGLKQYPNRVEILQILLEKGVYMGPTILDCEGNTPLHVAAQQANVKAFQLIALWITGHTSSCFDLCATNNAGRTALLEAIYADKNSTRLPIIQIMFSLGIGISKDEIEMLRRDGKLKLDIIKDIAEKYSQLPAQHTISRRESIVYENDRLVRTRSNLSGPNLSTPQAESAPSDLRGTHLASTSSLQSMSSTPRRNSFIDSATAAAAALSMPPETPRKRGTSTLSLNLASTSLITTVSSSPSSTPPTTPRVKLPLDALRTTAEPLSLTSPRHSASGSPSEQNRPRSRSIRNGFGLFSPRSDSPSKQPATLLEAIRYKNYETLRSMLKDMETRHKRSEANQHGDNGRTALFEAVINVDKEAIRCFYESGICLSKIEMQTLLIDTNRNESIRTLNEVVQEVRNLLSDNPSPRPERRRGSILAS